MKMKKLITMGLAAIMAVSAMSISVLAAEESNAASGEYDFFNTEQILDFNPETGEFDSTFVTIPAAPVAPAIHKLPKYYSFTFDQNVTKSGKFLANLTDPLGENSEYYLVGSDDTMVINLDNKPSQKLTVQLYKPNGTTLYGPTGEISTTKTAIKLSNLYKFYGNIGSLKIKIKTANSNEWISGSVTED